MQDKINGFLDLVRERNGNEPEFIQAVEEVAETVPAIPPTTEAKPDEETLAEAVHVATTE